MLPWGILEAKWPIWVFGCKLRYCNYLGANLGLLDMLVVFLRFASNLQSISDDSPFQVDLSLWEALRCLAVNLLEL